MGANSQDGGGGFKASAHAPHWNENVALVEIAQELSRRAAVCSERADNKEDPGYMMWRSRTLRVAASLLFECCGKPDSAESALVRDGQV